jgi:uncharacterized protein
MRIDCIKGGGGASVPGMKYAKPFYLTLGWVSVALGAVGVLIPVFPTTPFLLVAIWAFSKSSPELAARIRNHKTVGPYIRDWEDRGVIPLPAKALALTMMSALGIYLVWWSKAPGWLSGTTVAMLIAISVYIATRPSR